MTSLLASPVIREAAEGDFGWVSELMNDALTPFYGGDHVAHARRIFDTHMAGGIDAVGHFSASQHMFIAEIDGQPAGLIHVVGKKQDTAKISPLIIDPAFKGRGLGPILLEHAERFAEELGARQVYCTVASSNQSALGFFRSKGYRITGTARNHYKQGVDEHMLYKQLGSDTDLSAPNISVVPFERALHEVGVRKLVLGSLQGDFLGVDDAWVDALFAGYERRNSGDVNAKFKVIFVAECNGEILGVAGATPKKGDPVKLMPLAASHEAAFEALIIDLQSLLADFGHKLYVHLVPEAWQIDCLQRHGWNMEGLFPGGYAPESVVQQWGLEINNGETNMTRKMRIKRPYFDAIMKGEKTLEVRVGYGNIKRIRTGDLIELETSQTSGLVRVTDLRTYDSFVDMLEFEPWQQIVPNARDKAQALRMLQDIYPSNKEALGIYVFQITPERRSAARS